MFDDINLVQLLSSSKPIDIARNLTDEQIRLILPSLIWLGLQQCPKNHRLTISAQLLQIVSRFHDMDSIIELFEIDFHTLNIEIKRLQRIKQKLVEGGQQNSNALLNQEIITFEQTTARDRCRIVAQILFDNYEKDQQLITISFTMSFKLRTFSTDEVQQLLDLLLSPTTNVTLGLCFLFMIPSLVERNEQTIIEWLVPTMSSLSTDDKLLMIGLFCMTNYNEPLNALVSSTLDFPCRIDPGPFHHSRLLLIQRVFTNDLLVQRFATIQITPNLNANITIKHIPAHFICYLLSKGLCNQHHVQMSSWVWSQILQCTTPIHPIMLTLINELVTTIVDTRYVWHLTQIDTQIIYDYLTSSEDRIPTKMLSLLYLLTLNDQATGDLANQYHQSTRILFDLLPLPHLVEQLTTKDYDAIAPQLGRLMMEQLPQVFLADHALYLETDSQLFSLRHAYKTNKIENLTDQLKTALINGISRKQADQWRRRWFRVYAFRGQLLTLKTAQILLDNNQLTYDDLCADPHCLLRFPFQLYNYPSIIQIILFIMREILIASRHYFERIIKAKQQPLQQTDMICIQDVKSKQLQETLVHTQEALVIQILLDVLHQYKKTACLPAYRELQGVVCSFVHQMFITNPVLAKLVHFQGYPSEQIKPLIYSVPSMHICLDFIPQMLASSELDTQIFGFDLLTDLSSFYPIRTALLVVKLALQVKSNFIIFLTCRSLNDNVNDSADLRGIEIYFDIINSFSSSYRC
ncbi:unnamed protein product [Rotaria sp. Silwood2]|nr:unnamed protein product [Rotaria sp. Silwood2]